MMKYTLGLEETCPQFMVNFSDRLSVVDVNQILFSFYSNSNSNKSMFALY